MHYFFRSLWYALVPLMKMKVAGNFGDAYPYFSTFGFPGTGDASRIL